MTEKKKAGCFTEFVFILLSAVVGVISIVLVVFGAISGNAGLELVGIAISVIFAILVFMIPYLRRNSFIRWLAWLSLADAAWWTYTMFAGF